MSETQQEVPLSVMRTAIKAVRPDLNPDQMTNSQVVGTYRKLQSEGHIGEGVGIPGVPSGDQEQQESVDPKVALAQKLAMMQGKAQAGPVRPKVTTSQLRRALDEILRDSEEFRAVVEALIKEMADDLKEKLGINADIKELTNVMLEEITGAMEAAEARVNDRVAEKLREIEQKATTVMEFHVPEMPAILVKDQHHKFGDLLFNCHLREPTMLVGPTGSGKTTAAMKAAEILGVDFSYLALGPTQTEAKLAGYQSATGHYVPTEFYLRYRYGGVLLLDEIDAANPSVLVWMNGAVANKVAGFPRGLMTDIEKALWPDGEAPEEAGGMVKMHKDCIIIASANTAGKGADMMYHGRNALDASTLKRFRMIIWEYDTNLEHKIAPLYEWTNVVQAVRESVMDLKMPHPVSPVDSISGGRMILAGKPWMTVANETIFAGLKNEEVRRILGNGAYKKAIDDALAKMRAWDAKRQQERAEAKATDKDADTKPTLKRKQAQQAAS